MDGWEGVKAGLRIAYSNQLLGCLDDRTSTSDFSGSFMKQDWFKTSFQIPVRTGLYTGFFCFCDCKKAEHLRLNHKSNYKTTTHKKRERETTNARFIKEKIIIRS